MNPNFKILDVANLIMAEPAKPGSQPLVGKESSRLNLNFGQVLNNNLLFGISNLQDVGIESIESGSNGDVNGNALNGKTGQEYAASPANIFAGKFPGIEGNELPKSVGMSVDSQTPDKIEISSRVSLNKESIDPLASDMVKDPRVTIDKNVLSALKGISTDANAGQTVTTPASNENDTTPKSVPTAPIVDIDRELSTIFKADSGVRQSIDHATGALNITDVKLIKSHESRLSGNDKIELDSSFKPAVRLGAIDSTVGEKTGTGQFSGLKLGLSSGMAQPLEADKANSDNENVKNNNFEALIRPRSDNRANAIIDSSRALDQVEKITAEISPSFSSNTARVESAEAKAETTPVRFVLPTNISDKPSPNHHTIMIRMEPDHLGPVRMTLTSNHDILTARLVVDSVAAKATVESNLNNLVEQLDRQGVKVDAFEVSVSGGQVGREFADRKMAGSIRQALRRRINFEKLAAARNISTPLTGRNVYIGANGVNCFA